MNLRHWLALAYVAVFIALLPRGLSLEFNGDLIALLPEDNPHLETYAALGDLRYAEGGFDLILVPPAGADLVGYADDVAARLADLRAPDGSVLFQGVELENDLYALRPSLPYLLVDHELDTLHARIETLIAREIERANPLFVQLDEDADGPTQVSDFALGVPSVLLQDMLATGPYEVDADSTQIRLHVLPAFPRSDFDRVALAWEALQRESAAIRAEGLYWGGSYLRHYHKVNDVREAVTTALVIGIGSLVFFLLWYMVRLNRKLHLTVAMLVRDILVMFFVLFSGFGIVLGLASFVFTEINIFTGIIFSILFGINLDYILHLYALERQPDGSRSAGVRPILVSAVTTGVAILSLVFSHIDGFVQFGSIFFASVVVNLAGTFLLIPFLTPSQARMDDDTPSEPGSITRLLTPDPTPRNRIAILAAATLILIGATSGWRNIGFTFDFASLEPQGEISEFDIRSARFPSKTDTFEPAYFMAGSLDEARALFDEVRLNPKRYPDIDRVESLAARFPFEGEALNARHERVLRLKALTDRYEPLIRDRTDELGTLIALLRTARPPRLDALPDYVRNRFFLRNGELAPLVLVYPAMSLSDGQRSIRFRQSSGAIETGYGTAYAASTSIIAASILEMLIDASGFLILMPLTTILLMILIAHRSWALAALSMAPVLISGLLLVALNLFAQMEINLYNVIVFPILIGVGADNGIHLAHTWKHHKDTFLAELIRVKLPVLAACSITTVLGFTGLLFIDHPGIASIGILAIAGVLANLLATWFTAVLIRP